MLWLLHENEKRIEEEAPIACQFRLVIAIAVGAAALVVASRVNLAIQLAGQCLLVIAVAVLTAQFQLLIELNCPCLLLS